VRAGLHGLTSPDPRAALLAGRDQENSNAVLASIYQCENRAPERRDRGTRAGSRGAPERTRRDRPKRRRLRAGAAPSGGAPGRVTRTATGSAAPADPGSVGRGSAAPLQGRPRQNTQMTCRDIDDLIDAAPYLGANPHRFWSIWIGAAAAAPSWARLTGQHALLLPGTLKPIEAKIFRDLKPVRPLASSRSFLR
jgi:hypothetical protein